VEKETISGDLKPNEVLVRMDFAPVNPADLNIIEGTYGTRPKLPAVAGLEGVGTVQAVGSAVKDIKEKDRVIPAQPGFGGSGTWRTHALATEDQLIKIASDIPIEYAAAISVNPATAYRLLTDFGDLKPGDTVIQNGGNSMVGRCVVQIAKARGIRTVSVVRQSYKVSPEEQINHLKQLGGDIVVNDKFVRSHDFKELFSDIGRPKLALNCIGGDTATEIARSLADGGTLVTYGAMSKRPVILPNSLFIFRNITHKGFWLTKWVQEHSKEERQAMINELVKLVQDKKLKMYLEAFKLSHLEECLVRNAIPFRDRKFLLELQK
jgi:trans-2-enoyl-CoA reductase